MYIFNAPIIARKEICENTEEVSFGLEGSGFTFEAGQYVRITIPKLLYPDPLGNYRDFSIASSPNDKKMLRIAMRKSSSGFKRTLFETAIGSGVKITGPFGLFTLPKDTSQPVIFIAGGIGITPFLSKISFAAENNLAHKITLIFVSANKESAPYVQEVEELAKQNPNLTVKFIFGKIKKKDISLVSPDIAKPVWQIGGPPEMDITVREMLLDLGIKEDRIGIEEFVGYEPGKSVLAQAHHSVIIENSQLAQSLVNLPDESVLVSVTDGEGTIVFANDTFVRVSKYSREELVGQNHRILKSGHQPEEMFIDLWKTISGGKTWRGEIKNRAKDGSYYWVDATIKPIFDDRGKIVNYVAFRFVVTERKLAEEKAKEADRAKSELINLASHQLRTPLSGTKWLIETLNRKIVGPLTQKQKDYLDQIYQLNERMIKLVFDMLGVLRLESGQALVKKETVSFAGIFKEVSLMVEAAAKSKGIVFSNALKKHKTVVLETDLPMLRSILETFISNAINYSEPGQEILLDAKEETDAVTFFVKDNGIGIPKDEQEQIFERFYRASNAKALKPDGTGLGLYIAAMLAEKIGAKITFESEVGKGSTFYLRIPK